jgi:ATP-dependent phosphofructokinase / diphosphate-dependent phosphofructokinase
VDTKSESYRIATQYMIRLSAEDLDNPVELGRCAALVGLSPEQFRGRFGRVPG